MTIPILIPAYKPDNLLPALIKKLIEAGMTDIIIVDDGSGAESEEIFNQLEEKYFCHICRHAVNMGKGRAIKTGLNYALTTFREIDGIVTADADGQHLTADILKVKNMLSEHPRDLVMGCRSFSKETPFRSKFGNEITKVVFHLLVGIKVSDTQSGLRGIPFRYLKECLRISGERYEYEINMLASCRKHNVGIQEIPIETVYIDNNHSSHFNPLLDSIKIYFVLFRFILSSLSTALIDFIVFIISTRLGLSILGSIIVARIVAGNYNFIVNKKIVFKSESKPVFAFIKYWLLVVLLGSISYMGIHAMVNYFNINVLISKALIETLLFTVSFAVQRDLIFYSGESPK